MAQQQEEAELQQNLMQRVQAADNREAEAQVRVACKTCSKTDNDLHLTRLRWGRHRLGLWDSRPGPSMLCPPACAPISQDNRTFRHDTVYAAGCVYRTSE